MLLRSAVPPCSGLLLPVVLLLSCSTANNTAIADNSTLEQRADEGREDRTPQAVAIRFDARVGSEPAACGTRYNNLGSSAAEGQLADARMFLSNIELRANSGDWLPLNLTDNSWQDQGVALLDFEDGTSGCQESGNADTNSTLEGLIAPGTYDAVRFDLGVPFELNHVDVSTADSPLNDAGMFWVWRGGYKFLRVDWMIELGAIARWNVHLGSTGCMAEAPTDAPEVPCSRTNSPRVELQWDAFEAGTDDPATINIDLAQLLNNANPLLNTTDTPPGCQSNPGEADDCTAVFSSLGMTFNDGSCRDDCRGQLVFSVAN